MSVWLRHLRPRVSRGRWTGSALPDNGPHGDEVRGCGFTLQWLGLAIDINAGIVREVGK